MSPVIPGPGDFAALMLLCDHVAVAEGKFYINGGGWDMIGPAPAAFGLAIMVEVPWTQTNRPIVFELELVREDGPPVTQQGPAGEQPIKVAGEFEVGRPPGSVEGAHIPFPLPLNFPPMVLPPGDRLVWRLSLNGDPVASVPFRVRPMPTP